MGVPLLIHQPSYSMLNRWVEERRARRLLDVLGEEGVGCIAFSPLAQGMLTDRYLDGIPEDSRAAQGKSLDPSLLTDEALAHVRRLNEIARRRGQSLAQLALAWVLRDERVTSVLIGASSVRPARRQPRRRSTTWLRRARRDREDAVDSGINIWRRGRRSDSRAVNTLGRPRRTVAGVKPARRAVKPG